MAFNLIDFMGLIRELIADEGKMNKFREIIGDVKELINDIKDVIEIFKKA